MQSVKNIKRQFLNLKKQPDSLFSIELTENIFCWNILFFGPPDTIYENGLFKATMTFPKDFPNSPPVVQFIDNIFHPNIYPDGKVWPSLSAAPAARTPNASTLAPRETEEPIPTNELSSIVHASRVALAPM